MKEDKDAITLEALKSGSDFVLKRVYEENRTQFLNYARRFSLSDDDNMDVYQDAYVIFYNNIMGGKVRELTSSISTYLFGIGKRLIYERMRKEGKKVDFEAVGPFHGGGDPGHGSALDGPDLSREQQLLYREFGNLGPKCQELLSLFYYRGYTVQEIMEAGNYNNENVVKAAKSRCLKTLKERINPK